MSIFVDKVLLDFCRVKKIFDKGFGFLTSLYFEEPVFFHFNNVKDKEIKEKLENLNRSDVYVFFTSVKNNDKRKADKLWFNTKDIPQKLLPIFIDKIIKELDDGKTNIFEIAYAVKQLMEINSIGKEQFGKILNSKKVLSTPSVIKAFLSDKNENTQIDDIMENLSSQKIAASDWVDKILDELYK